MRQLTHLEQHGQETLFFDNENKQNVLVMNFINRHSGTPYIESNIKITVLIKITGGKNHGVKSMIQIKENRQT